MAFATQGSLIVTFVLLLVIPLSAPTPNVDLVESDVREGDYYDLFVEGEAIIFIAVV